MKCAEELEDPFGYDYNDLNMDHFTHNIIRKELQAITSLPMPDPAKWAFSPDNDAVFDIDGNAIYLDPEDPDAKELASPNEWVKRGEADIRAALANGDESGKGHENNSSNGSNNITPHAISLSNGGRGSAAIGGGAMPPSGNHSFGGPGGAGLVAGSAIAAAGMNVIDPSSAFDSSPSPPSMPPS